MKIGQYEITPIETGRFALDGGAMFGIVPWALWSKVMKPDERQRIALAARCLLLRGVGKNILIDDGNGTKLTPKQRDIYKIDDGERNLESSLANYGLKPTDITDVILTHLHFDHAGGSTKIENGKVVPTFPNARYYVQKDHWKTATNPSDKDRGSFMPNDYLPLQEHGMLEFLDGEGEIFPGISLILCHGHTTAQQLPKISDGTTTLLFCCDLFPTMYHIAYPYVMAYDLRPLQTIEEKKNILPRAYEDGWILVLEHDPEVEAIKVTSSEKGFVVAETLLLDQGK